MANKKFSEFVLKTSTSDVSHIVGYNGAENVQITPANFVTGGGTGVFLPLAGGTMTGDIVHNDNVKSTYGNGNDLQIYHDGTDSYIKELTAGSLKIWAKDFEVYNAGGTETLINADVNGGVQLFYDNTQRFATTSTGISVTSGAAAILIDSTTNEASLNYDNSTTTSAIKLSNNDLKFELGGSERMRLDSLGNLGVGTSTPGNYRLNVSKGAVGDVAQITDGVANTFVIRTDANTLYTGNANNLPIAFVTNNIEKMRLDASGNLGLGTSSPTDYYAGADNLVIKQASGEGGISIVTANDSSGALYFADGTSGDEQYRGGIGYTHSTDKLSLVSGGQSRAWMDTNGNLGLGTDSPDNISSSGTVLSISTPGGLTTNSLAGSLTFITSDGSFTGTYADGVTAEISSISESSTGAAFALAFSTSRLSDRGEKMRLDKFGNLGINTTDPAAKLVVNQDSLVDTEGIFVQADSNPADGGVAIFKSASKVGTISALGGASSLSFMTDGGSEKMRINDDGDLLVGKTASNVSNNGVELLPDGTVRSTATDGSVMDLNRKGTDGNVVLIKNDDTLVGSISVSGTATAYNTSSDYRLKEDLQDFEGLDLVSKIPVYDYKWKANDSRSYGVMAHELEEVLPQAVSGEKDAEEMQSVDYSKIVPLLVKSIQELSAKLESLECQCEKK